jgi:hypothetical protein
MALRSALFLLLTGMACSSAVTVEPVLQIVSISPTGGSANVNVDSNVLITFNADLDTGVLNTEVAYLLDAEGELVLTDLLYAAERWTLTLDPVGDLEKASDYTLVLTTDIASEAKGTLVQEVQSTFRTTGDDPQNAKPIADPGGAQYFQLGTEDCCVDLTAAASYDPEGAPLTYVWRMDSQPEGSSASLSSTTDIDIVLEPDQEGDYLIRLVVNDGLFDSDPTYLTVTASLEPENPDTGDTGGEDSGNSDSGPP